MKINTPSKKAKKALIGLYGPPGVGKSTLASTAKNPVFIDVEDAIHQIKVAKTDLIRTSQDLKEAIAICAKSDHDTIVLDTLDSFEDILIKEICKERSWQSLSDAGYGKGYATLKQKWLEIFPYIHKSINNYNKTFILVGHDTLKRIDDPVSGSFDKIVLKLNHHISGLFFQYCDCFFYMRLDETTTTDKNGVAKILSDGSRVLLTQSSPSYMAKNRYDFPSLIRVNSKDEKIMEAIQSKIEIGVNE